MKAYCFLKEDYTPDLKITINEPNYRAYRRKKEKKPKHKKYVSQEIIPSNLNKKEIETFNKYLNNYFKNKL